MATPTTQPRDRVSPTISDVEVEMEAYPLCNQHNEVYHTIPAEKCRVGIVSRRRIGSGPDGKTVELPSVTEAAFIRGNGAWLPAIFRETNAASFP